jgi:hypothetical protein
MSVWYNQNISVHCIGFFQTSTSAVHVGGEQYKTATAPLEKKQPIPRTSPSNTPVKRSPDNSPLQPMQPHR